MSSAAERTLSEEGPAEAGRVVIVGGSAAGLSAATALRRHHFEGEIVVIEGEHAMPYERPPLSKAALSADWDGAMAPLLSPSRIASLDARFVNGGHAVALDTEARTVRLSNGEDVSYDELIIATGLTPRRLPGSDLQGVHVLRTAEEARRLRLNLEACDAVVIVGGGFLGLEAAFSVRAWLGVSVTVIEPEPRTLEMRIGARAAERLEGLCRDAGIEIVRAGVRDFIGDAAGARVKQLELADGRTIDAGCVLLSIGAVPTVGWLEGSGLRLADGVVCDEYCRAAPSVWAAGDICRWYHQGLGRSIRLEHRTNATEQGMTVAQNIMGAGSPYTPIPYFWTDQGDVRIQVAGVLAPEALIEYVPVDPASGSFLELYRLDGEVVGLVGWNAGRAFVENRRAVRFVQTREAETVGGSLAK